VADAPNLPETTADGDPGHTAGHDDTNRSVNALKTAHDTHAALTSTAHGGIIGPQVINAKGDLIAGTANDNFAIVPAGADGELVVYDSAQTTGIDSVSFSSLLADAGLGSGGNVITVQDEGVAISTAYGTLNFRGTGVVATEDTVNNRINIDISTGTTTVNQKSVASDQSVASSTTLVDGSGLSQAIAASEVWEVSGIVAFRADAAADIKLTMVSPTGSVQLTRAEGINAPGTTTTSGPMHATFYGPSPTAQPFGGLGASAGNEVSVKIDGQLRNGSTAGNWKLQWAQQVSSATASVLLTASFLTFARVS
jgi:hypothetical protein